MTEFDKIIAERELSQKNHADTNQYTSTDKISISEYDSIVKERDSYRDEISQLTGTLVGLYETLNSESDVTARLLSKLKDTENKLSNAVVEISRLHSLLCESKEVQRLFTFGSSVSQDKIVASVCQDEDIMQLQSEVVSCRALEESTIDYQSKAETLNAELSRSGARLKIQDDQIQKLTAANAALELQFKSYQGIVSKLVEKQAILQNDLSISKLELEKVQSQLETSLASEKHWILKHSIAETKMNLANLEVERLRGQRDKALESERQYTALASSQKEELEHDLALLKSELRFLTGDVSISPPATPVRLIAHYPSNPQHPSHEELDISEQQAVSHKFHSGHIYRGETDNTSAIPSSLLHTVGIEESKKPLPINSSPIALHECDTQTPTVTTSCSIYTDKSTAVFEGSTDEDMDEEEDGDEEDEVHNTCPVS